MEQYKEKLKIQNIFLAAGSILLILFAIAGIGSELGWFSWFQPIGSSHWQSTWYGYLTGVSCGLGALMIGGYIRNRQALKDEKKLKKLYIKENDERTMQVYTCARNTAMQILLIVGLVATVIAGYFSPTVSITILACTFTASITSLIFAWYYSKKF